jgi:hypothetical protein
MIFQTDHYGLSVLMTKKAVSRSNENQHFATRSPLSFPAKAGNPVTTDSAAYWLPRFHPKSALTDFGTVNN